MQFTLSCNSCICVVSFSIVSWLSLNSLLESSSIRASPGLSSILSLREYFWTAFLEVLFLAQLILHEVWPALFEILKSLDWYKRFPNDWNQVVAEDHEQNCRDNLLCFHAFALQILLLQACNLHVLQRNDLTEFSRLENLNRVSFFQEPVDVLRKISCRKYPSTEYLCRINSGKKKTVAA